MKITVPLVLLAVAIVCLLVAWTYAVPDFLLEGGNWAAWLCGALALWAASDLPWKEKS